MTRRASHYVLPDGVTPAAVRVSLESHFDLDADPAEVVERAYFDTFDGLAREAGVLLLWEGGRLLLVNRDDRELAVLGLPRRPGVVRAADLPAGEMRDRLAPVIEIRAAESLVRVRVRRQAFGFSTPSARPWFGSCSRSRRSPGMGATSADCPRDCP